MRSSALCATSVPSSTARSSLRYEDILRGQQTVVPSGPVAFRDYDRDATLRITWEAYVNFTAAAEAGWLRRSGSSEYDGEWAALRFRFTF